MSIEYLTDIIILLAAAVIAVPLFQSLGLGAIPGFLVAGIVLGPSGLGYIENYDEIAHLAEVGVVFARNGGELTRTYSGGAVDVLDALTGGELRSVQ